MSKRKSFNIEATLRPGESQERLLKRFFKKVKKSEIIREHLDKTSYFKTKSQKRRDQVLHNKFVKKKSLEKNTQKEK